MGRPYTCFRGHSAIVSKTTMVSAIMDITLYWGLLTDNLISKIQYRV